MMPGPDGCLARILQVMGLLDVRLLPALLAETVCTVCNVVFGIGASFSTD